MIKPSFHIDAPIRLIQKIRLIHALCESDFEIRVNGSDVMKFTELEKKFDIDLKTIDMNSQGLDKFIQINHQAPMTTVGHISKPLIFPHEICDYCRNIWRENRTLQFTFAGLITLERKEVMENWIESRLGISASLAGSDGVYQKLKNKVCSLLRIDSNNLMKIGPLSLWSSSRGRKFPIKAWDDNYFQTLGNSQFVLCPSGDFVWSYRFFEAILCGAIPIVEKVSPAYAGFRFSTFDDDLKPWSAEDAEHNYTLCRERITIPKIVLNDELTDIWKSYDHRQGHSAMVRI